MSTNYFPSSKMSHTAQTSKEASSNAEACENGQSAVLALAAGSASSFGGFSRPRRLPGSVITECHHFDLLSFRSAQATSKTKR